MFVALAGGVGAARFLAGLVRIVPPEELVVVGNTGDDETFFGLHVSPDLDTVTYTLGGVVGPAGWGIAGDTFACLDALSRYGEPTWFRLGDADLATHLHRTARLAAGATLSEATAEIAAAFGLRCRLVPMSDDRVATRIDIVAGDGAVSLAMAEGPASLARAEGPAPLAMAEGPASLAMAEGPASLAMQEWFVRDRCEPPVAGVRFEGAENAMPAPGVLDALEKADGIFLCPSNPVISIGPILALGGVRDTLRRRRERVVGVSPIIRGAPVRGPADRLMAAVGLEVSCAGVAGAYADICGTLLVDVGDASRVPDVEAHGVRAEVAPILMGDAPGAERVARAALAALGR